MLNIIISGVNGKMGQVLSGLSEKTSDIRVAAGVDKMISNGEAAYPVYTSISDVKEDADIIIDFSRPDSLLNNISFAKQSNIPLVIATTGFSPE